MRECSRCGQPSKASYCKECDKAYRKEKYAKRKKAGLCINCKEAAVEGSPFCKSHKELIRKYRRIYDPLIRRRRAAVGMCHRCGKRKVYAKEKTYCELCLTNARKRMRKKLGLNPQKRYAHEKDATT